MQAPSSDVRRRNFAAFVKRAVQHAEVTRGWSIPRIADEAGVSNATIYRWRDGIGTRSPQPDQVVAFCDALDIAPTIAFSILWPGKEGKPAEPEPLPMDPDVQRLLQRITDPAVPNEEKIAIRATIQFLVGRSGAARRAS